MFRPAFDGQVCSLGYEVVDWLTEYTCHGPGDVQGEPIDFTNDPEVEDFIIRCYEIDPETGRRKKSKAVYSAPKGRAKSETAGLIGVAEALAPVRFDGWDANGQPVGRPVRSPFIRCLATEENQAGNTFQNIAYVMSEWGPDVHPDIYGGVTGARNYQSATALYLPDGGQCVSSSSGAASKDGGKETFLVPDEIHLYVLRELRDMYATAMRNLGKRFKADPWALLTTTACRLGEQSVWETLEKQWRRGELGDEWLIHHREAKGKIDIDDRERTLRQLRDVYGAAMDPETGWMAAERIYADMTDPSICPDEQTAVRYFLNRSMAGSDAWIAKDVHERQTRRGDVVEHGEAITLGFDGSLNNDTTVLRGCRMSDGFLFKIGAWAKPDGAAGAGWEVPRLEVLAAIREAFGIYDVVRMYADPHEWRSDVETLAAELGEKRVIAWPTDKYVAMSAALDRLHTGLSTGEVWHDDDPLAHEHYGNAYVQMRGKARLVRKEYPNSPRKIDSVVGDALALEARADALTEGWGSQQSSGISTAMYGFN
jgi:phage terminase large subunit-like protein